MSATVDEVAARTMPGGFDGDLAGARVLLLGVGHFGGQIEAARFLCARGARVIASDLKTRDKLEKAVQALEGLPIEWRLGEHRESDLDGCRLVVVSPAVPKAAPFLQKIRERGIPMTTEMNLTIARMRAPILAVTGSNGKSTTTSLLGKAVEAAGLRAFTGGNIGHPLLNEIDQMGPDARAVLELSSFQLEDLREAGGLAPRLAIVTNLTPNHLDRHGTMEEYAAAKRVLVERQGPGDVAALNREDPRVLAFAAHTRARVVTFGLEEPEEKDLRGGASYARDGFVRFRGPGGVERRVVSQSAMPLAGRHNLMNALAVVAGGAAIGLPVDAIGRAIAGFAGIPDRMEFVIEKNGVRFVNDSKATTPEAAAAAIAAFPRPLVWIAGGKDKGMDPSPMIRAALERTEAIFLIGTTREPLKAQILDARGARERPSVQACDTLEAAFSGACAAVFALPLGGKAGTVLFSPAYASYDMFASYEERGERFRALARSFSSEK